MAVAVGQRSRILLVEDEPDHRRLLAEFLREEGYDVCAVASGEEALAAAVPFRPHALVLDLWLPGIDGEEVLRRYREAIAVPEVRRAPEARVVLITAASRHVDVKRLAERLVDVDILPKPFDLDELLRLLPLAPPAPPASGDVV